MLSKTFSASIQGVEAVAVEVEVNATGIGEQTLVIMVGLPDAAVRESRERVHSALLASGFLHPWGRTTISLAPADLPKQGSAFDLPIALGMIASVNQLDREALMRATAIGELALDGNVRAVPGALPVALQARASGRPLLLVPAANAQEAGIVEGLEVIGVKHLAEAVDFLKGDLAIPPTRTDVQALYQAEPEYEADFAEVKGQEFARRAAEVAAAGGHNMLLIGPPGTGKSMIASRLPSILPAMSLDEAIQTTRIYSIAGALDRRQPLVVRRPFRTPHHTISDAGLLGGQSNPKPGEISLAHNGVLFLDEFTEFRRQTLEVMRQPLESGEVTIARALGSFTFPSRFQLVAAMNPCPCGYLGSGVRECRCSHNQKLQYRARISGPLLDRIDLHVEVGALGDEEMLSRPRGECSAVIRSRVAAARDLQRRRFAGTTVGCNAAMTPRLLQEHCALDKAGRQYLKLAINDMSLSNRAHDRILRVARTLADLAAHPTIRPEDISEAVQYRNLDRQRW